jgi:hypothetical protein
MPNSSISKMSVEHEGLGGLSEPYAFIEALGILLGLDVYLQGAEVLSVIDV